VNVEVAATTCAVTAAGSAKPDDYVITSSVVWNTASSTFPGTEDPVYEEWHVRYSRLLEPV